MIGQTISHYKILEKLGEGGMGVVYKAQDTKLDRLVALKFLPPHLAGSPAEKRRFIHEARAASALNHPNICNIHEIDETHDGKLFIVMALYEGIPLNKKIEQGPFKISEALDVAIQAAEGLQAAHEKVITHRDVKSGNIFLTEKGRVVIMDFGLARSGGMSKLTKTGSTLGTVPYMSPEQARGEKVDSRTDIWSLGTVLYEMVTGRLPFKREYEEAVLYAILNENPQPVTSMRSDVPMELERIINKCLEKDASKRYQHADELVVDLRQVRSEPIRKVKTRQSLKWALVGLSVIVLILLAYILATSIFQQSEGKNSLAVVYFENIADPEDTDHTGDMLINLLITSLSQVEGLEITSREKLYHIQSYLGQPGSKTITPTLAAQIARQAGVRWMLTGSILQKEPMLVVTTRLVDVNSGNILSSQKLSDIPLSDIFGAGDKLAGFVIRDLQLSSGAMTERKSVIELATTSSPEAYRAYVEGIELTRKELRPQARIPLRMAIELDSTFAMAYFALARTFIPRGLSPTANWALRKAWDLRHKVSERERIMIEADYACTVEHDCQKSVVLLEILLQKYPQEQRAFRDLGEIYVSNLYKFDKAELAWLKAAKQDSLNKVPWLQLTYLYTSWGRKKEAIQASDNYLRLAPGEWNPYDTKGDVYASFGVMDSARYWNEKALAFDPFPSLKLGHDALLRKDYAAAAKYYQQFGDPRVALFVKLHEGRLKLARAEFIREEPPPLVFLTVLAHELHDYPSMLEYAKMQTDRLRKDTLNRTYGREALALAYLLNGDRTMAYEIMEGVRKDVSNLPPTFESWRHQSTYDVAMARLAFEEGKFDVAVSFYENAFRIADPNRVPFAEYGLALLKTNQVAKAIEELTDAGRRFVHGSGYRTLYFHLSGARWIYNSVKSHYWLGLAHEQKGDKVKAIAEYEEFLNIWKNADFNCPEIKDTRKRTTSLKAALAK